MKVTDLMVGDWITDVYKLPMQIYRVDGERAYADSGCALYEFNKDYPPQPIKLTPELLVRNGWKEAQYWHEYQDGKTMIQCCLPDMRGRINGIEIEHFKCEYVHQYQHLLRLCGLNELADNFKV